MIAPRKFRTKQAQKRENIRVALKTTAMLLGVVLLFGSIGYVSRLDKFRIQNIYVDTTGVLEQTAIANVIEAELDTSYFGLWPKDSIIILGHHKDIAEKLRREFPRIKDIIINRSGLFALNADIVEREPKALWCGDVVPPIAQEQTSDEMRITDNLWGTCYLMDEAGYIYAKAPAYSGNVFPRYYGSLQNAEPIDQYYIPTEEFLRWQDFYAKISFEETVPQAILFADERDAELYLSNGLCILLPRNEEMELLERRLKALFESEEVDTEREIEYIDLRFGSKAFIKYIDEEEEIE